MRSERGSAVPLCLIPLWDVDLAVAEVARNAARGVRAVAFSELPTFLGLPSIYSGYWDPLFRLCQETGTVVCMHVGSGTKTPQTSPDAPDAVPATILFGNSIGGMSDFMFSGVLERFPQVKLLFAECQIGWIPYLLERADDVWLTHRGVEQLPVVLSRAAVHVLLPADLQLLLQGRSWHRASRPRRSPQRGLRDGLSASRRHLAALRRGGRRAVRPQSTRDRQPLGAGERHRAARARSPVGGAEGEPLGGGLGRDRAQVHTFPRSLEATVIVGADGHVVSDRLSSQRLHRAALPWPMRQRIKGVPATGILPGDLLQFIVRDPGRDRATSSGAWGHDESEWG